MRPLLLLIAIVASGVQAQPAGWVVESSVNPQIPAAYKVVATRAIGQSKLVYERSMLGAISYRVEHDGCTSSSGGAGGDADPAAHLASVRTAMTDMVRDKDNFCKLPPAAVKGLLVGLSEAISAAEAAFARDRPTITVSQRTAVKDGWTIADEPGEAIDGLVASHVFTMRKAIGPILLTYTNALPLYSERVSAGARSIEGKVRECDYGDTDYSEFVSVATRAGAVRKQIASGLETTGCDVTPAQITAALTGFDAAFFMLEAWAAERLDERRLLLEAAGATGMNAMDAMSPDVEAAADAAAAAARTPARSMAECANEQPDGKLLPGC